MAEKAALHLININPAATFFQNISAPSKKIDKFISDAVVSGELETFEEIDSALLGVDFWKKHKKKMPVLASIYRHLSSVQPTNAASERAFSTLTMLVTKLRTRLKPEMIEAYVLMKYAEK